MLSSTLYLRWGLFNCLFCLHGIYLKWLMRTSIPRIHYHSFASFKKKVCATWLSGGTGSSL